MRVWRRSGRGLGLVGGFAEGGEEAVEREGRIDVCLDGGGAVIFSTAAGAEGEVGCGLVPG